MYLNILTSLFFVLWSNSVLTQEKVPAYIHQCKENDPKLVDCIKQAVHHLRPYLKKGLPEIQMPVIEPFRIDSLSLALTGGNNGYKITLRDMDIFGTSDFIVDKLKLPKNGSPIEAVIKFDKMKIEAKYTSSGVLIVLPASGNGTFYGDLSDIKANVRCSMLPNKRNGKTYYMVDKLELDLTIKKAVMKVAKIFNNNRVLIEATNLFLEENGEEVLKVMMPQLRTKLADKFKEVANSIVKNVPLEQFLLKGSP